MPHYNKIPMFTQYVIEFLNGKQFAYVSNRWQVLRIKLDSAHLNSYISVSALEHYPCSYNNQTYNPEQTLYHKRNVRVPSFRFGRMHILSNFPNTTTNL